MHLTRAAKDDHEKHVGKIKDNKYHDKMIAHYDKKIAAASDHDQKDAFRTLKGHHAASKE